MTAAGVSRDAHGTVVGNAYDKYGTRNPVARRLLARFLCDLDDLLARAAPASVLDVGCGEGVLAERWARADPARRVVGADLEAPALRAAWARRAALPNLGFRALDAGAPLPFAAGEFALAAAIEVLEHVPDPDATLAELARVSGRHVLVSVPREPLWRALNVLRGAYLGDLGNTPGHVHHFSRRAICRLAARHGRIVAVRSPPPWTMLLVATG